MVLLLVLALVLAAPAAGLANGAAKDRKAIVTLNQVARLADDAQSAAGSAGNDAKAITRIVSSGATPDPVLTAGAKTLEREFEQFGRDATTIERQADKVASDIKAGKRPAAQKGAVSLGATAAELDAEVEKAHAALGALSQRAMALDPAQIDAFTVQVRNAVRDIDLMHRISTQIVRLQGDVKVP